MSISGEEDASGDSGVDWYDWLATLNPHTRFSWKPVGSFGYINQPGRDGYSLSPWSTILSDGCCPKTNTYSGFAISLEEMRGFRTAQFLAHKSAIQEPSQDIDFF
ncbi:hypothetical protein BJX96DRAFT_160635, partial [Aspergillus floccosus]